MAGATVLIGGVVAPSTAKRDSSIDSKVRSSVLANVQQPAKPFVQRLSGTTHSLWPQLESVYRDNGIKPTMVDRGNYRITHVAKPAGKRIANMRIEKAVDCGGDKKAPIAASIPLAITLVSDLKEVDGGIALTTSLEAEALPTEAGGTPPVCTSTGALEKTLVINTSFPVTIRR